MNHGTNSCYYQMGCRREECRNAHRIYMNQWYTPAVPVIRKVLCIPCGKEFETTDWRQKYCSTACERRRRERALADDGAMSWEQIGSKLGISPQRAIAIYNNAIRKLRTKHPKQLARLRELMIAKEQLRRRYGNADYLQAN